MEAQLTNDFEVGHFIRERLVPRAVLYFTGEALDDEEVNMIRCCNRCETIRGRSGESLIRRRE